MLKGLQRYPGHLDDFPLERQSEVSHLSKELASERERHEELKDKLLKTAQQVEALASENHNLIVSNQRLGQQVGDLQTIIEEKQSHIQSLEEKHHHNRESLEHYRQSVRDQREQDQRRHEQQVQQLQAEQRQLNQTLSIKQSDITQLNKDNARLATELAETRKQLNTQGKTLETLNLRLKSTQDKYSKERDLFKANELRIEGIAALEKQIATFEKKDRSQEIELEKLRVELAVRTEMIDKFGSKINAV